MQGRSWVFRLPTLWWGREVFFFPVKYKDFVFKEREKVSKMHSCLFTLKLGSIPGLALLPGQQEHTRMEWCGGVSSPPSHLQIQPGPPHSFPSRTFFGAHLWPQPTHSVDVGVLDLKWQLVRWAVSTVSPGTNAASSLGDVCSVALGCCWEQ